MRKLTHLQRLEGESIHILREAVASCENPVMLYSMGKDSSVLLHLAMKAFYPSTPPFPLLHVDTTWTFEEMIAFRDATASRLGLDLIVHTNEECVELGINPFTNGSAVRTDMWKTQRLKQALESHGFDLAFGGARRDEEPSRATERIFSFRTAERRSNPKNQRPELWHLYNARKHPGESIRVSPLSNWTELDVWHYLSQERIPIVSLYFAKPRPVVVREGQLIVVDDDRMPLRPGERPEMRSVRFRTLGCYPLTGAIESEAADLPAVIEEVLAATTSERWRRVIDHDSTGSAGTKGSPLMTPAQPATGDVERQLTEHQDKQLLRFLTCGSVHAGKSTLIGRLLYETHLVFEDHPATLEPDSKPIGTQSGDLDFGLLVDGLAAADDQGITSDVAYRFFSSEKRTFIVADTPGHEQHTRNVVTAASTADVAVILIDARNGVLAQSRFHGYLASLLGVTNVAVAVNKLDAIGYDREVFDRIAAEYRELATRLGVDATCIPLSALHGDNVTRRSDNTAWYEGPTLIEFLESVEAESDLAARPFRMPVQWVDRPEHDFRGYSGLVVSGTLRPGDPVCVVPSGKSSRAGRIVTFDGDLPEAMPGDSITVTLDDEIDVSRGDVLAAADAPPEVADQFEATIVWVGEQAMLPGRSYLLKTGTGVVSASVTDLKHRVNVDTLEKQPAKILQLNEIGVCSLTVDRPIVFDPYSQNRDMGGFIIIDRFTNATVAAGMLHFALRRAHNVHWQAVHVDKSSRMVLNGHRPCVVWFTGLSGAGKSTVASELERTLRANGVHTYLLDGDNLRHGLTRDLGFTDADRVENIRRVAEVARLMVDAGLVVLASFISPFLAERQLARGMVDHDEFCEVYIDTPLAVAESRDPKGLYRKARAGQLKNFTGIDSPYEPPEDPEVHIRTTTSAPREAVQLIIARLRTMGVVRC